jgi:hypothetical protein
MICKLSGPVFCALAGMVARRTVTRIQGSKRAFEVSA